MRGWWTRRTRWIVFSVVVLTALTWYWSTSLVPSTDNVMDMGYEDLGGGPPGLGRMADMPSMSGIVSVALLTGPPTATPDVDITLVARAESFTLPTGQRVKGYMFNHQSPGPTIHATRGDLVQVTLVNESVAGGVTIHWHGVWHGVDAYRPRTADAPTSPADPPSEARVVELARANQKIQAIKMLRELRPMGLREAKDWVDAHE